MTRQLHCTCCHTPLTGGLDTYGDVGEEMCWECWSSFMDDTERATITSHQEIVDMEEIEAMLEDVAIPPDGIIWSRGMPFCFACGMLAQPGDENFDWCGHINETPETCPFMGESVFVDRDEDE